MLKANPSDWQEDFIATNLLAIGYNAWNGYLKIGREWQHLGLGTGYL